MVTECACDAYPMDFKSIPKVKIIWKGTGENRRAALVLDGKFIADGLTLETLREKLGEYGM